MIREGRSKTGNNISYPGLEGDNTIQIAFNHYSKSPVAYLFFRKCQSVEISAFCINRRFRRVQIFRFAFSHDSPAKGNDALLRIHNWKNDSPAKSVIKAALIFHNDQAAQL